MPVTTQAAEPVEYRYFVCDLLSGELLGEIPFTSVSYGRALREAGTFSGSISVAEETFNLSLYETTLPGKTALYVVRNGVCVWGGLIWTRNYNIASRTLEVSGSEMISYLHHRIIWKTWSNQYAASIEVSGGVAKVTINPEAWQSRYTLSVGEPVHLDWGTDRILYRNTYTILGSTTSPSAPNPNQNVFYVKAEYTDVRGVLRAIPNQTVNDIATVEIRQDTYDYARGLLQELVDDLFSYGFPNDAIEPGIEVFNELASYRKTNNIVRATTKEPHELVAGQKITVADAMAGVDITDGTVLTVLDNATFEYQNTTAPSNVNLVTATDRAVQLANWTRRKNITTVTTRTAHGFSEGDIVFISGLSPSVDGFHTIRTVNVPTTSTFTFVQPASSTIAVSPGDANSLATVTPAVIYSTWGPYKNNGNFGLNFSTVARSGKSKRNSIIRGFQLKTVGEALEEYSNVLNGFEYRIDSTYSEADKKFKNTMVFLPIMPPSLDAYLATLPNGKLPAGQFAPISAYGADKLIFEFPGNVLGASLEESAEESATRFWVQGKDERLGQDASQPYSGASDQDLLFRGWPILEQSESKDDIFDETELYEYASRFLIESKPPISNFTITVNGSLTPEIGSYKPGDWCGVIINDDFVKLRLKSYIELKDSDGTSREVLLRKIDAFSVNVPDNPAFPEEVSLELVTEAEVDNIGN
jgi:hypothetical protein